MTQSCRRCFLIFYDIPENRCGVCHGPLCPNCSDCPKQCWSPENRKRINGSRVHAGAAKPKAPEEK